MLNENLHLCSGSYSSSSVSNPTIYTTTPQHIHPLSGNAGPSISADALQIEDQQSRRRRKTGRGTKTGRQENLLKDFLLTVSDMRPTRERIVLRGSVVYALALPSATTGTTDTKYSKALNLFILSVRIDVSMYLLI